MEQSSLSVRAPISARFLSFSFCPPPPPIFGLCHVACRILVPLSGIKPVPPAVEAQILNHWTTREIPLLFCLFGLGYTAYEISVTHQGSNPSPGSARAVAKPLDLLGSSFLSLLSVSFLPALPPRNTWLSFSKHIYTETCRKEWSNQVHPPKEPGGIIFFSFGPWSFRKLKYFSQSSLQEEEVEWEGMFPEVLRVVVAWLSNRGVGVPGTNCFLYRLQSSYI